MNSGTDGLAIDACVAFTAVRLDAVKMRISNMANLLFMLIPYNIGLCG